MKESDVIKDMEICTGYRVPKSNCSECPFADDMSCAKNILLCAKDIIKLKNARIARLENRQKKVISRLDAFFIGLALGAIIVFVAWLITI